MKRRKFITIAALGSAVVALPAIGFSSNTFFKQAIASIVQRELHYLKLDEQGVKKFVDDFADEINAGALSRAQKIKMKVGTEYLVPGSIDKSQVTDRIVTLYLLSSDFFMNKMDEKRTVKYVGMYDTYKRACSNPFSHTYYPQQSKV